jgi:hypothetical protein
MGIDAVLAILGALVKVGAWVVEHTTLWAISPAKAADWVRGRKGKVSATRWDGTPTPAELLTELQRFAKDPKATLDAWTHYGDAAEVAEWIEIYSDTDQLFTGCDAEETAWQALLEAGKALWDLISGGRA